MLFLGQWANHQVTADSRTQNGSQHGSSKELQASSKKAYLATVLGKNAFQVVSPLGTEVVKYDHASQEVL